MKNMKKKPAMTQIQMYYREMRRIAEANRAFMEMVTCKENPMTREDLEALIVRRPDVYRRYASWLDKLPSEDKKTN